MEIVVFGAGSLGSLLGGLLAREHDVTLVGRDSHMRAIRERGLRISGAIEATVRPAARLDPPDSADLAVVCVKAFDTAAAANALADRDLDACLSLQNGMGNERTLADRLDAPVLAGTCSYGAIRPSPGEVRCTGVGDVVLGPRTGGSSVIADRTGAAFERAGVVTTVADDMPARLWEKTRGQRGDQRDDRAGPDRQRIGARRRRVADRVGGRPGDCRGCPTRGRRPVRLGGRAGGSKVAEATAENTSSMQQDVLADRRTEIDAINGFVVDRADEREVDVAVNRTLAGLVRAWETGRGVR